MRDVCATLSNALELEAPITCGPSRLSIHIASRSLVLTTKSQADQNFTLGGALGGFPEVPINYFLHTEARLFVIPL